MARLVHWWLKHEHSVAISGHAMLHTASGGPGAGSVTATHIDEQLHPCLREVQSESWLQEPSGASAPASCGAAHSPPCATLTPAQSASHGLGYVFPSAPQTGA